MTSRLQGLRVTTGLVAMTVALAASAAHAQSTGTLDFDKEIVVTAHKAEKGIDGVVVPDTSKAAAQLDQKWLTREVPGQAVNDLINFLPGVSFQNNDPFGSAGGTLTIRGFDATRISETFDGVTLNDDGNYALYASEMLDSEVIDSVRVNLGTTDVDSPTASASGSTVNFVSHMPTDTFHLRVQVSGGNYDYYRLFGMVDTGVFTGLGTKAWFSGSKTGNSSPFNNYGVIRKEEYNGKIYQPIGANGFIWIAGFYATLRNNFSGSDYLSTVPLAADTGTGFTYFPTAYSNAYYTYPGCTVSTTGVPTTCGTAYEYRPNPTNIGNLRVAIKIPLSERLTFTADPSYQFTKANGGGTAAAFESPCYLNGTTCTTLSAKTPAPAGMPITGYINGAYYLGQNVFDDNEYGKAEIYVPSETVTHRVALTTSLIYELSNSQSARIAYALSDSRIRQTGEASLLPPGGNGAPIDVFAVDTPLLDGNGNPIEKRNYHSIAALNQVSGEYKGHFFDNRLSLNLGLRAPFLTRNLTALCFTRNAGGSLSCVYGASGAAYAAAFPASAGLQTRSYHYSALLPNLGVTYQLPANVEFFANYSKGLQAPNAIALYQSFYFTPGTSGTNVAPEKADNIDAGLRYNSGKVQAQVDLWYTHLINKLDTAAYNSVDQTSIYANLGPVNRYGIDANVNYKIDRHFTLYAFGSVLKSKIEQNIDAGLCSAAALNSGQLGCTGSATEATYFTGGKFEAGIPKYTIGGRIQADFGSVSGGIQVKRTGERYVNAQNLPEIAGIAATTVPQGVPANGTLVYPAQAPAYTLVDFDVRVKLEKAGLPERSFVQLNVTNLFNEFYVGGFSQVYTNIQSSSGGTAQVGAPRAIIGTLAVAF